MVACAFNTSTWEADRFLRIRRRRRKEEEGRKMKREEGRREGTRKGEEEGKGEEEEEKQQPLPSIGTSLNSQHWESKHNQIHGLAG